MSQSLISRWLKNKENISDAAAEKKKKLFKKQRKPEKCLKLYRELFQQLKAILETVVIQKHVISIFLSRYRVGMRARQRNKKERKPKKTYRDVLIKWHSVIRECFICTGGNSDSGDPKWGPFLPSQKFNLDQSPMFFVIDSKKDIRDY